MKTLYKMDYSIHVRPEELEENPRFSKLYRGIYSIVLNKLIDIVFVPEIKKTENNWPPTLPDNIDEPDSEENARLWTIGSSKYSVTPNLNLAGQEEKISIYPYPKDFETMENHSILDSVVVYYVSPKDFDLFSQNLSMISKKTIAVYDYVTLSEIFDLPVSKFLLNTVFQSENFNPKDWEILNREF